MGQAKDWTTSERMNPILGWGLFSLDLGTDLNFSINMHKSADMNFTDELLKCKEVLISKLDNSNNVCRNSSASLEDCFTAAQHFEIQSKLCFEIENKGR